MEIPFNKIDEQTGKTDDSFLKLLLCSSISCSIAASTEEYPLVQVAFFSYDEKNNDIIFHFSKYGLAGQQITEGKKVCLPIYKYGKLYTADKAVDFG